MSAARRPLCQPAPEVAVDLDELDHVRNDIAKMNEPWVLGLAEVEPEAPQRNVAALVAVLAVVLALVIGLGLAFLV